ncbi:beta-lactamase/transpeptidase-like protein, partial [Lentithecium fluviatile CBS 122367]
YALAREVTEKLSGQSYGDYIHDQFLEPLGLIRTTTKHQYTNQENFATPYAALDDGSPYKLPPPPVQDGTIMVSAQGIQSSVNDLLKFSSALMQARHGGTSPFKNAAKQFESHIPRGAPFLDKSYGLGLMRTQLPNTVGGGCNAQYGKLPTIVPGGDARLIALHGGSQAGYTSFLTMLPEIDTSLVVLTNSIGLADPSGWINELIIETLVESPNKIDFVQLARDAAQKHFDSYHIMEKDLEQKREANTSHRALEGYTGHYINDAGDFMVEIRQKNESALEVVFQGLESQVWDLRHYQHDTFLWLTSRDEQAKRARFTYSGASIYKIIFNVGEGDAINGLYWPHDPSVPVTEQWFGKIGAGGACIAKGQQEALKST